jgi:hypothetical protein
MKSIAGSIVVLAGAVLFAGGTIAEGLMASAGKSGDPGALSMILGALVGVCGLAVVVLDVTSKPKPHP